MTFEEEFIKEHLPKGAWELYLLKKQKKELDEAIEKRPTLLVSEAFRSYYKAQVRSVVNIFSSSICSFCFKKTDENIQRDGKNIMIFYSKSENSMSIFLKLRRFLVT
jgi:hypothetical protein